MQLGLDPVGYAVMAMSVVVGLAYHAAAFRCLKQAGLDIARANRLPDRVWKNASLLRPTQFDAWLAKEKAKLAESALTEPPSPPYSCNGSSR